MLLGMALYKRKVFKARKSYTYYLKMIGYGIGLGLPLVVVGTILDFNYDWDFQLSFFSQLNYCSVLMALGYIGVVVLISKTATRSYITSRLIRCW